MPEVGFLCSGSKNEFSHLLAAFRGLMSHGPNLANAYRRLGIWAGMLLDGAEPGELPDAGAGYREFILNLKTAKALGRSIPNAMLLRADALIQ